MGKTSRPTPHLVSSAKLRSGLSRSEFFRLFPEKVGEPARPAFMASQASSHVAWRELLNDPLAKRAAQTLLSGNSADDWSLAAVIAGHLAAGPVGWQAMGIDRSQARELWAAYTLVLHSWKRKDVNAHLRQVSPVLVLVNNGAAPYKKPGS